MSGREGIIFAIESVWRDIIDLYEGGRLKEERILKVYDEMEWDNN